MDLLFELIVWIIRAITKPNQPSSTVKRNATAQMPQRDARRVQPPLTTSEQKTRDIWGAYRKKQEMLEGQFRAKAPK